MLMQTKLIGILGGLGPFAHVDFEHKLLACARDRLGAQTDQHFPAWVLSSIPATPDRTAYIVGEGQDPRPWLRRSLRQLQAAGAHFVCVPCNTAHYFLADLAAEAQIPIEDMIRRTAESIALRRIGPRVGVLATTGTLRAGLYERALRAFELQPVSLLDLPDGERWQCDTVMRAIYGASNFKGLKSRPPTRTHRRLLEDAGRFLVERGRADVVVAACTELSLAITGTTIAEVPLLDPGRILAEHAISAAYS